MDQGKNTFGQPALRHPGLALGSETERVCVNQVSGSEHALPDSSVPERSGVFKKSTPPGSHHGQPETQKNQGFGSPVSAHMRWHQSRSRTFLTGTASNAGSVPMRADSIDFSPTACANSP